MFSVPPAAPPWLAGFNGDTMDFIPESFWTSALALNHPLALQTEGTPSLAGLGYTKMAWGYWDYPVIPGVDSYKWLETRHITQVSDRWAQDHTNDIQGAFFNGESQLRSIQRRNAGSYISAVGCFAVG